MVRVDSAPMAIEVVSEMLNIPHNSQGFQLGDPIIALMGLECAAGIGDRANGSVRLLLREYREPSIRGVCF